MFLHAVFGLTRARFSRNVIVVANTKQKASDRDNKTVELLNRLQSVEQREAYVTVALDGSQCVQLLWCVIDVDVVV